jgi:hypothetical protein
VARRSIEALGCLFGILGAVFKTRVEISVFPRQSRGGLECFLGVLGAIRSAFSGRIYPVFSPVDPVAVMRKCGKSKREKPRRLRLRKEHAQSGRGGAEPRRVAIRLGHGSDTSLEKRSIFFRHFAPLLDIPATTEPIDLSRVVLTHYNIRDLGQRNGFPRRGAERL